jgi:lipopolysaccharide transport system ATP-binding protein
MSDVAISVENISKCYRIGTQGGPAYHRLSEMITGVPRALWNAGKSLARKSSTNGVQDSETRNSGEFWALKDVSFEVKQGEVVGIIGRNGAGKSTLLKILSRITEPTRGRFGIRGRVASLLEVGTGFHPELTGRENIYVSGVTLGMTRAEIRKTFDEIVDFSGVEKFLDAPVKHYSSGMQVRLGFAVATNLQSEILIVDEVLAVGDAEFQKKCLGKMGAIAKCGRTVLLVSHHLTAIRSLCEKVLWLADGVLRASGEPESVLPEYHTNISTTRDRNWCSLQDAPGNENVRFRSISISSSTESKQVALTLCNPLQIKIEYWILVPGIMLTPSLVLKTCDGTIVLNTFPVGGYGECCIPGEATLMHCICEIPPNLLNDERYILDAYIIRNRSSCEWHLPEALIFELTDDSEREGWYGKWSGVVRPNLCWSLNGKRELTIEA